MTEKLSRWADDVDSLPLPSQRGSTAPGKSTLTSRHVMRKEQDDNGVAPNADAAVDQAASSSGEPLPPDLRERFEGSLGTDLSAVRVHTGAASAEANDAVGANAYATGQDIHFAAGQYDPTSQAGQFLIAHEVAHTVQQSGDAPTTQYKLAVSSPGDGVELEADRAAAAMVVGAPAEVTGATDLARQTIHRDKINWGGPKPGGMPKDTGQVNWGGPNPFDTSSKDGIDPGPIDYVASAKAKGSTTSPTAPQPMVFVPFSIPMGVKKTETNSAGWQAFSEVAAATATSWSGASEQIKSFEVSEKENAEDIKTADMIAATAGKGDVSAQANNTLIGDKGASTGSVFGDKAGADGTAPATGSGFAVSNDEKAHLAKTYNKTGVSEAVANLHGAHDDKKIASGNLKTAGLDIKTVAAKIQTKLATHNLEKTVPLPDDGTELLKTEKLEMLKQAKVVFDAFGSLAKLLEGDFSQLASLKDVDITKAVDTLFFNGIKKQAAAMASKAASMNAMLMAKRGYELTELNCDMETKLSTLDTARAQVTKAIHTEKAKYEALAAVTAANYQGGDSKEGDRMATAIRAIPIVQGVLKHAQGVQETLPPVSYSDSAGRGYAIALAKQPTSATSFEALVARVESYRAKMAAAVDLWGKRLTSLQQVTNALAPSSTAKK